MIITRKHQESLIADFAKNNTSTDELLAFGKGMDSMMGLVDKLLRVNKN